MILYVYIYIYIYIYILEEGPPFGDHIQSLLQTHVKDGILFIYLFIYLLVSVVASGIVRILITNSPG